MARNTQVSQEDIFERLLKDRSARIAAVRQSHLLFFHIYFSRYVKYGTAPFHKEIFELTENAGIPLAVLVAFRSSGKSTIVTTSYPLWAILGQQQKKFVLIISRVQTQAQQHLRNIRHEVENNKVLGSDLGPFDSENGQYGLQALVFKKLGAKIMIASVDQSIRGLRHLEHRPDLIILDDVEDTSSVKTQENRNNAWQWFTSEILPIGSEGTRIFAVGNLLHRDSLLKRIESQIATGTLGVYREYPIIKNGVPTWLHKYPNDEAVEAERKRIMDRVAWHREYLLEILPDDDQLILPQWIQHYDTLPTERSRFTLIGLDPAISKEASADCTAILALRVYGSRETMKVFVLPQIINKRLTFNETIQEAETLSRTVGDGSRAHIYAEKVAYQQALIEQLKVRGNPVDGISPGGHDKHARLASITHFFETGKLFFPKTPVAEVLINQLLGFGVEKHDDLVDALTLALHQVMHKDRYGGSSGVWSAPPREEDLRHLNSRQKFVIMEKWIDYKRPDAI